MKPMSIIILLTFTFLGTCIGLLIGQKTAPQHTHHLDFAPASHAKLNAFYTSTLKVSEEQKRLLAPIEKNYHTLRQLHRSKLSRMNYELANLIEQKGYENPDVSRVVTEINKQTKALQHLILQHLTQVDGVLSKNQSEILKDYVVQRLRQNP